MTRTYFRRNSVLKHMYSIRGRCITIVLSLAICIALRLPAAWATIVYEYPNCPDFFRSQTASAAPWVRESLIYHVYDFHLLSIAQTFIPFVVLFVFNVVSWTFYRETHLQTESNCVAPHALVCNMQCEKF